MTDQPLITVRTKGQILRGWKESEIGRSIENLASTFRIPVDLVPGQPHGLNRGDEIQVYVADTLVLTGYLDNPRPGYNRSGCGLRLSGRSKTGDLVRSSALHKGGQWVNATLERIAKDLAAPFGIEVVVSADIGAPLADFKLSHGESCVDALSRAAKLRGVLVTTDDAGRLLLTKAGTLKAPGAIRRGVNVIEMMDIGSDEQRYQQYIGYAQTNVADDWDSARQVKATATDDEVTRYSVLLVQPDGNVAQSDLQAMVDHTARVRRGHSFGYQYMMEGWLVDGKPWPVNARVPIYDDVAGLEGEEWLICSARLTVNRENAAVTVLEVRPIEAYDTVPLKTKVRHRKADRKSRGRDGARLGTAR